MLDAELVQSGRDRVHIGDHCGERSRTGALWQLVDLQASPALELPVYHLRHRPVPDRAQHTFVPSRGLIEILHRDTGKGVPDHLALMSAFPPQARGGRARTVGTYS